MADEKELIIVEQKQVQFYGDEIVAVRVQSGVVYVPLRPICDLLGLEWGAQRRRVYREPVLGAEVQSVAVRATDSYRTITRKVLSLPLDLIAGFLFGIDSSRVKPELKERLIRYQRECYRVLAEAFREGRLTADPTLEELLATDSPAVQAYKAASAILQIARQQVFLEAQLQSQANQLATHTNKLTEYERRLELVESTLGHDQRHITPAQASEISQAVKAVAMALSKQTKRNEYGGVYGEMYRRFAIPSYKELPANRFAEAMGWLNEWLQTLNSTTPF